MSRKLLVPNTEFKFQRGRILEGNTLFKLLNTSGMSNGNLFVPLVFYSPS